MRPGPGTSAVPGPSFLRCRPGRCTRRSSNRTGRTPSTTRTTMTELPELPQRAGDAPAGWRPPTQMDVAHYLGAYSRELDKATAEVQRLGDEYAEAKAEHRVAYARAYLSAQGTVKDRDAEAVLATANEFIRMEAAEQKLKASRERVQTLRTQIGAGQSIGAAIRAEIGLAGAVGP